MRVSNLADIGRATLRSRDGPAHVIVRRRRRLGIEVDPLHRPAERLDAEHHFAVLKQPHRAGRFADGDGHRRRRPADLGRRPVAGAKTLGQRQVGRARRVDLLRAGHDVPVGRHDERPVELGDFLDALADLGVGQVPLGAAVAAQRIEAHRPAEAQHLAMVADDEQRADRLALAAFAADVDRQIDDRLERVERNAGLELPQVADRQLAQVLAQADDAERIDHRRLEAAVHGDDRRPGRQQFVGHRFQAGPA